MGKKICDMENTCLEVPGTFGFTKKELFVTETGPDDDCHEIRFFRETGGKVLPPLSSLYATWGIKSVSGGPFFFDIS